MENPLITVIVPVYRVEKYLERCVNSIINQTYKNLEIILVDDGSPDRCGEMCDELAKTDSRIRVIHKENGGLSSARNAGLDIMTGEYVGFVDSDDWIEPEMYETLYKLISENDAQISHCGSQFDFPDGKIKYFNPEYPQNTATEVFSKTEALKLITFNAKISNASWDKLYKAELFDDERFTEGFIYEDYQLLPYLFSKILRLAYNPAPLHHYVMTGGSITRGKFTEKRFQEADVTRQIAEFYREEHPKICQYASARHFKTCLDLIYLSQKFNLFKEKQKELIDELKQMKSNNVFKLLSSSYKLKYILLKLSAKLYLIIITIYTSFR